MRLRRGGGQGHADADRIAEVLDGTREPSTADEARAQAMGRLLAPSTHPPEPVRAAVRELMLSAHAATLAARQDRASPEPAMSRATVHVGDDEVALASIETIDPATAAAAARAVQDLAAESLRAGPDR